MSDALDNNIEYAISRQGGLNYLWNVNIKYDKNTKIKIRFIYDEDDINNITRYQKRNRLVEEKALSYELTIEYYSRLTKNMRIKNPFISSESIVSIGLEGKAVPKSLRV